ncbi:hypothetical protein CDAR_277241 [Caerostris darwini]|uniref:Uncharacterized protein n=1 Tax=Caerostris darwini TaxID=1538125 RepID=A0AAV4VRJ3_9ARAC|nr:hypothetical protein CDAR_277241 [Caerostris darwini]
MVWFISESATLSFVVNCSFFLAVFSSELSPLSDVPVVGRGSESFSDVGQHPCQAFLPRPPHHFPLEGGGERPQGQLGPQKRSDSGYVINDLSSKNSPAAKVGRVSVLGVGQLTFFARLASAPLAKGLGNRLLVGCSMGTRVAEGSLMSFISSIMRCRHPLIPYF